MKLLPLLLAAFVAAPALAQPIIKVDKEKLKNISQQNKDQRAQEPQAASAQTKAPACRDYWNWFRGTTPKPGALSPNALSCEDLHDLNVTIAHTRGRFADYDGSSYPANAFTIPVAASAFCAVYMTPNDRDRRIAEIQDNDAIPYYKKQPLITALQSSAFACTGAVLPSESLLPFFAGWNKFCDSYPGACAGQDDYYAAVEALQPVLENARPPALDKAAFLAKLKAARQKFWSGTMGAVLADEPCRAEICAATAPQDADCAKKMADKAAAFAGKSTPDEKTAFLNSFYQDARNSVVK